MALSVHSDGGEKPFTRRACESWDHALHGLPAPTTVPGTPAALNTRRKKECIKRKRGKKNGARDGPADSQRKGQDRRPPFRLGPAPQGSTLRRPRSARPRPTARLRGVSPRPGAPRGHSPARRRPGVAAPPSLFIVPPRPPAGKGTGRASRKCSGAEPVGTCSSPTPSRPA